MQEIDRIAEANEHLDRRALQRQAAAEALNALTPEVVEKLRAQEAAREAGELVEPAEFTEALDSLVADGIIEEVPTSLSEKLAAAVQPVLEAAGDDAPQGLLGLGRFEFQWAILPSEDVENVDGLALCLYLQVNGQEPGGFEAEITRQQLEQWAAGKGLQGNRIEHKQFVQALFDRAIGVVATETANHAVYVLEHEMLKLQDPPTETAVGEDDGPFADAPENADEVPE